MSRLTNLRQTSRLPVVKIQPPTLLTSAGTVQELAQMLTLELTRMSNTLNTVLNSYQLQIDESRGTFRGTLAKHTKKLTSTGKSQVVTAEEVTDNVGGEGISTLGASSVKYADSSSVESLKPGEAGADVTGSNTAASIVGQGSLATKNNVDLATGEVTNKTLAQLSGDADDIPESITRKWAGETGADVTSGKTAAAITGQGTLATKNSVDLATAEVTNKTADQIGETITRKWASESGADITSGHTASAITGQGALATKSSVATADIDTAAVTTAKISTGAVTSAELAASAVTTAKIANQAVTSSEIAPSAVTSSKISNTAVSKNKLATSGFNGWTPNGNDSFGRLQNAIDELQTKVSDMDNLGTSGSPWTPNKPVTGGNAET